MVECVLCGCDVDADRGECPACGTWVCEECNKTEGHYEGDFQCTSCQRWVCKSYLYSTEGHEQECWFCSIQRNLDALGPLKHKFLNMADSALSMPEEEHDRELARCVATLVLDEFEAKMDAEIARLQEIKSKK